MTEYLEEIKKYWTLRAEGYSDSIIDDLECDNFHKWLDVIEKHVGNDHPLNVLDIGTGPGFFPVLMGQRGHRITAVDYAEAMLEKAKDNCSRYGVHADLHRMDAQNLEFEDESFDLILSRNLIWDLENPKKAYSEWLRVLRPEGKMIVFDGNHYLHLHDQDYAEAVKVNEGHRYIGDVDTNIIRNIAMNLPLSKERRPQWDVNTLMELGARSLEVNADKLYQLTCDGETVFIPHSFHICATK